MIKAKPKATENDLNCRAFLARPLSKANKQNANKLRRKRMQRILIRFKQRTDDQSGFICRCCCVILWILWRCWQPVVYINNRNLLSNISIFSLAYTRGSTQSRGPALVCIKWCVWECNDQRYVSVDLSLLCRWEDFTESRKSQNEEVFKSGTPVVQKQDLSSKVWGTVESPCGCKSLYWHSLGLCFWIQYHSIIHFIFSSVFGLHRSCLPINVPPVFISQLFNLSVCCFVLWLRSLDFQTYSFQQKLFASHYESCETELQARKYKGRAWKMPKRSSGWCKSSLRSSPPLHTSSWALVDTKTVKKNDKKTIIVCVKGTWAYLNLHTNKSVTAVACRQSAIMQLKLIINYYKMSS